MRSCPFQSPRSCPSDFIMGIVVDFVNPVLFELGSFKLYTYGFFLALAFLVTQKMLEIEFKRHNIDTDTTNILIAAAVGGIVGAKLHYVLTWDADALFDLNVGLSFQGGLLGGAIVVAAYIKYTGENVGIAAEDVAPLMPLGHAIGKLGCFFSGDGCYGGPTNLPWGMSFPNGLNPTRKFVHPAPLYEFIISFSIFAYYFFTTRNIPLKNRKPWDVFTRVLTVMCLSRIIVELWRDHDVVIPFGKMFGSGTAGINQYQLFALVAALIVQIARWIISRFLWNKKQSPPQPKSKKTN